MINSAIERDDVDDIVISFKRSPELGTGEVRGRYSDVKKKKDYMKVRDEMFNNYKNGDINIITGSETSDGVTAPQIVYTSAPGRGPFEMSMPLRIANGENEEDFNKILSMFDTGAKRSLPKGTPERVIELLNAMDNITFGAMFANQDLRKMFLDYDFVKDIREERMDINGKNESFHAITIDPGKIKDSEENIEAKLNWLRDPSVERGFPHNGKNTYYIPS
jgi:hypothetical protein